MQDPSSLGTAPPGAVGRRVAPLAALLVAVWLGCRLAGSDSASALAVGFIVAVAAASASRSGFRQRLLHASRQDLAAALALGLGLAGTAIAVSWLIGADGGSNWALRHGLQLGWWTDRLPFMNGKLLATVVAAAVVATLVVPEELLLRGVALRTSERLGLGVGTIYALQATLGAIAGIGDLWLRPAPVGAWATQLVVAALVATCSTFLARRSRSLLPPILAHAALRAALVVHAFAFIPRLYR